METLGLIAADLGLSGFEDDGITTSSETTGVDVTPEGAGSDSPGILGAAARANQPGTVTPRIRSVSTNKKRAVELFKSELLPLLSNLRSYRHDLGEYSKRIRDEEGSEWHHIPVARGGAGIQIRLAPGNKGKQLWQILLDDEIINTPAPDTLPFGIKAPDVGQHKLYAALDPENPGIIEHEFPAWLKGEALTKAILDHASEKMPPSWSSKLDFWRDLQKRAMKTANNAMWSIPYAAQRTAARVMGDEDAMQAIEMVRDAQLKATEEAFGTSVRDDFKARTDDWHKRAHGVADAAGNIATVVAGGSVGNLLKGFKFAPLAGRFAGGLTPNWSYIMEAQMRDAMSHGLNVKDAYDNAFATAWYTAPIDTITDFMLLGGGKVIKKVIPELTLKKLQAKTLSNLGVNGGVILTKGILEGETEGVQTLIENQMAIKDFDPDRDPWANVRIAREVGYIFGMLMGGGHAAVNFSEQRLNADAYVKVHDMLDEMKTLARGGKEALDAYNKKREAEGQPPVTDADIFDQTQALQEKIAQYLPRAIGLDLEQIAPALAKSGLPGPIQDSIIQMIRGEDASSHMGTLAALAIAGKIVFNQNEQQGLDERGKTIEEILAQTGEVNDVRRDTTGAIVEGSIFLAREAASILLRGRATSQENAKLLIESGIAIAQADGTLKISGKAASILPPAYGKQVLKQAQDSSDGSPTNVHTPGPETTAQDRLLDRLIDEGDKTMNEAAQETAAAPDPINWRVTLEDPLNPATTIPEQHVVASSPEEAQKAAEIRAVQLGGLKVVSVEEISKEDERDINDSNTPAGQDQEVVVPQSEPSLQEEAQIPQAELEEAQAAPAQELLEETIALSRISPDDTFIRIADKGREGGMLQYERMDGSKYFVHDQAAVSEQVKELDGGIVTLEGYEAVNNAGGFKLRRLEGDERSRVAEELSKPLLPIHPSEVIYEAFGQGRTFNITATKVQSSLLEILDAPPLEDVTLLQPGEGTTSQEGAPIATGQGAAIPIGPSEEVGPGRGEGVGTDSRSVDTTTEEIPGIATPQLRSSGIRGRLDSAWSIATKDLESVGINPGVLVSRQDIPKHYREWATTWEGLSTGRTIVFVEAGKNQWGGYMHHAQPEFLFVNVDGHWNTTETTWHEFLHTMEFSKDSAERQLYKEFRAEIDKYLGTEKGKAWISKVREKSYKKRGATIEQLTTEAAHDLAGEVGTDPKFWKHLASEEGNPKLFRKIVKAFLEWWDGVKAKFFEKASHGLAGQLEANELSKIREALAKLLVGTIEGKKAANRSRATRDINSPDPDLQTGEGQFSLDDFGEKIGGSRKDLALSERLAQPAEGDDVTIGKDFPKPNYKKMIKEGFPADALAVVAAIRDSIPRKPTGKRQSLKRRRWIKEFNEYRSVAGMILEDPSMTNFITPEDSSFETEAPPTSTTQKRYGEKDGDYYSLDKEGNLNNKLFPGSKKWNLAEQEHKEYLASMEEAPEDIWRGGEGLVAPAPDEVTSFSVEVLRSHLNKDYALEETSRFWPAIYNRASFYQGLGFPAFDKASAWIIGDRKIVGRNVVDVLPEGVDGRIFGRIPDPDQPGQFATTNMIELARTVKENGIGSISGWDEMPLTLTTALEEAAKLIDEEIAVAISPEITSYYDRRVGPGSKNVGVGDRSKAEAYRELGTLTAPLVADLGKKPKPKRKIKFDVYRDKNTGDIFIGKKGRVDIIRFKEGLSTPEEGFQYIEDNRAELEEQWDKIKNIQERGEENLPRVARPEYQPRMFEGEIVDATATMFQDAFGFYGVEFGNWVEGSRRQADLNRAYDALFDLSRAIGVPTKALSLNGTLGLAFGARGRGGRAAAHYEPSKLAINLTKTAGPGSLAHEWFHALDNYFARINVSGLEFQGGQRKDGHRDPLHKYASEGLKPLAEHITQYARPEIIKAWSELQDKLSEGEFSQRSLFLDQASKKPYFSQTLEKAARGFEKYAKTKLAEATIVNDYLVNINEDPAGPYPTNEEMSEGGITQAYDNLFSTIETQSTKAGIAMFSLDPPSLNEDLSKQEKSAIKVAKRRGVNPALSVAAVKLKNGVITPGEYGALARRLNPWKVMGAPNRMPVSRKEFAKLEAKYNLLQPSQRKLVNKDGGLDGQLVEVRIDIRAHERALELHKEGKTDAPLYIATLHEPATEKGRPAKVLAYVPFAYLEAPEGGKTNFVTRSQSATSAIDIAMGINLKKKDKEGDYAPFPKFPLATLKGIYRRITKLPKDIKNWQEVGYNSIRSSEFTDVANNLPVVAGQDVFQLDNRAYVKDAEHGDPPAGVFNGQFSLDPLEGIDPEKIPHPRPMPLNQLRGILKGKFADILKKGADGGAGVWVSLGWDHLNSGLTGVDFWKFVATVMDEIPRPEEAKMVRTNLKKPEMQLATQLIDEAIEMAQARRFIQSAAEEGVDTIAKMKTWLQTDALKQQDEELSKAGIDAPLNAPNLEAYVRFIIRDYKQIVNRRHFLEDMDRRKRLTPKPPKKGANERYMELTSDPNNLLDPKVREELKGIANKAAEAAGLQVYYHGTRQGTTFNLETDRELWVSPDEAGVEQGNVIPIYVNLDSNQELGNSVEFPLREDVPLWGPDLSKWIAENKEMLQKEGVTWAWDRTGPWAVIIDPSIVHSTGLVTYDDAGNVIPLDKRFGPTGDIQFSLDPEKPTLPDSMVKTGININDSEFPFTDEILKGRKTIETRSSPSLKPYVGQRVGLVRTGVGEAQVVGYATIGKPVIYNTYEQFRADSGWSDEVDEQLTNEEWADLSGPRVLPKARYPEVPGYLYGRHLVRKGSKYDFKETPPEQRAIGPPHAYFGYPLMDITKEEMPFKPVGKGIVARQIRPDALIDPKDIADKPFYSAIEEKIKGVKDIVPDNERKRLPNPPSADWVMKLLVDKRGNPLPGIKKQELEMLGLELAMPEILEKTRRGLPDPPYPVWEELEDSEGDPPHTTVKQYKRIWVDEFKKNVLEYITNNKYEVKILSKTESEARWRQHANPGGNSSNYQEILFQLPGVKGQIRGFGGKAVTPAEGFRMQHHYKEYNITAWARKDFRQSADGTLALSYLAELQADMAQVFRSLFKKWIGEQLDILTPDNKLDQEKWDVISNDEIQELESRLAQAKNVTPVDEQAVKKLNKDIRKKRTALQKLWTDRALARYSPLIADLDRITEEIDTARRELEGVEMSVMKMIQEEVPQASKDLLVEGARDKNLANTAVTAIFGRHLKWMIEDSIPTETPIGAISYTTNPWARAIGDVMGAELAENSLAPNIPGLVSGPGGVPIPNSMEVLDEFFERKRLTIVKQKSKDDMAEEAIATLRDLSLGQWDHRIGPNLKEEDFYEKILRPIIDNATESFESALDRILNNPAKKEELYELLSSHNQQLHAHHNVRKSASNEFLDKSWTPFWTTWYELPVKYMLWDAVKNNKDALTWPTGRQQIDFNEASLRKAIDKLVWEKEVTYANKILEELSRGRKSGCRLLYK